MGKKKAEEKPKWKFCWKNVGWFGMLLRIGMGIALLAAAKSAGDDKKKAGALGLLGLMEIKFGLLRWCPLRAIRKKPTKRAFRRHYPEADAA